MTAKALVDRVVANLEYVVNNAPAALAIPLMLVLYAVYAPIAVASGCRGCL